MKVEYSLLFCFNLELDSDFDSHDGSDNENENSIKYDVSINNIIELI